MKAVLPILLPLLLSADEAGCGQCRGCPGPAQASTWLEVYALVPSGPADQAGIRVGDVLENYDGRPVRTLAEFAEAKAAAQTDSITLKIVREQNEMSFRIPGGQLGAYLNEWRPDLKPDPDAKIIPGISALSWSSGKENSFMAALEAVLQHLKVDADYTSLCGVSGAAFRTHFFDTWCPSSPDPGCGFDATEPALQAGGYHGKCLSVATDGKNKPEIVRAITASIDAGMPVLAWDLIEMPECGIITGYQKQGDELFCRTFFDKRKGYELATKFPFVVIVPEKDGAMPERKTSCRAGFKIVADNLTTEKYDQYYSGLAAFDKWQERLRSDDFTKLDSAKLSNVVQANYWIYSRVISDRRVGIEYLARLKELLPAHKIEFDSLAALYRVEVDLLAPLVEELPCPGICLKADDWPRALRNRQIDLLARARALEEQALPVWQKLALTE